MIFRKYLEWLLTDEKREEHEERVQYGMAYSPSSGGGGEFRCKKGVDYRGRGYESKVVRHVRKRRGNGEISMYEARYAHKHQDYSFFTYSTSFLQHLLTSPYIYLHCTHTPYPASSLLYLNLSTPSMLLRYIYAGYRLEECRRRSKGGGKKKSESQRVWRMIMVQVEEVLRRECGESVF